MGTNNKENRLLTKEEEARLAVGLRKALISENPNPSREGCPDPKMLRDLALHKRIGDPETFERITNHMAECSACVRDALGYVEEYKEHTKRRRNASLALALVATLVLTVALWAIWRVEHQHTTVAKSPAVPSQSSPVQSVADARAHKNNQAETSNLTMIAIDLPLSWRGPGPADHPIILPRGRLQIEIRLPIGSAEGIYKLRISDISAKVQKTAESTTRAVDGIARLQVTLDTSDLFPGNYRLNLLEPGSDEWAAYHLILK